MRVIGLEEHISFPEVAELQKEIAERLAFPNLTDPTRQATVLGPLERAGPEVDRIPTMDKYGMDVQVLSISGSAVQNDLDTARAVANAKLGNDKVYALTKQYPDRFRGLGILAMQDPAAAVDELQRCVEELGFIGVMLHGPTNFHYYDEPQFEPVWALLEQYHVPMYIHAASPEADQIRMYEGYSELLGNTWNWNVFAATHALRIIFSGLFDRHPDAMLMLGHMAEGLPYFLGRLDEGYDCRNTKALGRMAHPPSYYIRRNILMTTSGGWSPAAMHCAIEAIGAEHIFFATDYPNYPVETSFRQMEDCNLTQEQLDLIYHGNAERLFGI